MLFAQSPILALFLCVALGYAIGKIRVGTFQLGGTVGTPFAAILVGQIGVPVDAQIKTMAFAMFIYSPGYMSGPQLFSSLGRAAGRRDDRVGIDRNGVYATRLNRVGMDIGMRPRTRVQAGDIVTLYGPADMIESAAREIGYSSNRSDAVDYVYLGLGIIVGILVGMITVPIAGAPVMLLTLAAA